MNVETTLLEDDPRRFIGSRAGQRKSLRRGFAVTIVGLALLFFTGLNFFSGYCLFLGVAIASGAAIGLRRPLPLRRPGDMTIRDAFLLVKAKLFGHPYEPAERVTGLDSQTQYSDNL